MLELNLDIQLVKKDGVLQLCIFDCTGDYDAVANLTGFGDPNLEIANISLVSLQVVFPDGIAYNIDASTFLPNLDGTFIYLPYAQVTGTDGTFVDGEYTFTYVVEDDTLPNAVQYSFVVSKFFYCVVDCCVQNKFAVLDLEACKCDGNADEIEESMLAWVSLEALKSQACFGQLDNARESLKFLQKICNTSLDCGC